MADYSFMERLIREKELRLEKAEKEAREDLERFIKENKNGTNGLAQDLCDILSKQGSPSQQIQAILNNNEGCFRSDID